MPELPEVETIRRGIASHLLGQRIVQVVVRQPQLRWPIPEALILEAAGQTIERVARRSKYLLLGTGAGTILLHLGMSGRLRLLPTLAPLAKHDHVDMVLGNGQCLRFNDSRRFGAVLWTCQPPEQHELLRNLGLEPFDETFSAAYLHRKAQGRRLAVKMLMMDNRIVVGIGNIYANEALFVAGISPLRPAGQLTLAECQRLVNAARGVLQEAIRLGGTTLRDFVGGDGEPGYFQQHLQVYGRQALPCLSCGTSIEHCRLAQRATYFCPNCQP